jgi:hypothetical protein
MGDAVLTPAMSVRCPPVISATLGATFGRWAVVCAQPLDELFTLGKPFHADLDLASLATATSYAGP